MLIRDARLQDYLIAIGMSGAIAIVYLVSLQSPERNALTRFVNRYVSFWSKFPLAPPFRAQMWIGLVVASLIAVGTTIALVVAALQGRLP